MFTIPFFPSLNIQNGECELKDFKRLFDAMVHHLLISSLPPGKFSGRTKLLKRWTQVSAFIDLSPPIEKTGPEIKSLTTSLKPDFCLLPSIE